MYDIKLYTIAYTSEICSNIEPGYLVLDNRENLRPDWREYWPIRNFLLNDKLEEDCYYGFFSPKFSQKTGISYDKIKDFINSSGDEFEVFLFTTYPDLGAVCLNVFEQNEFVDKGFTGISQMYVDLLGYDVNLNTLVMDSRSTVFSNFIIASKSFWLEWLKMCEIIFAICEGGKGALAAGLTAETTYTGNVHRKVFLIERVASLLLAIQKWKVKPYNTWLGVRLMPKMLANFQREAQISDALKIAYNESHHEEYLQVFYKLREIITKNHHGYTGLPK